MLHQVHECLLLFSFFIEVVFAIEAGIYEI